ncbi:MAG: PAS domain S-box protein [Vicinamibacteraceae bacterium]
MSQPSDLTLRHLAKVVESSDDAIVSKDLNGTIVSWNRAAERMFGYTAAEVIGRSIRIVIPPERQSEEDTVLATIRAGRAVSHFETIRQRKNGTQLPISLTVSPILDEQGVVVGASKIARDISVQRQAAFAMQRLAAVVASSDDAIITKDLDGLVTSWNPAAERIFGFAEAEAIGRSIRMVIPDELQGEEDIVLARLRAGQSIDHYETVRCRKDGTRLSVSLTVSPMRDDTGTIIGASKIARDVSESVRLRAAAREHAEITQKLADVGVRVAATLDRDAVLQLVTDTATELTQAAYGAFAPAFRGEEAVRLDDVSEDPRHRQLPPVEGMPPEHPPIRSYLAVPVRGAHGGDARGGLVFGHPDRGRFTEQHERIAVGIAGWASIALENARLLVEAQVANRMKDEFLAVLSHELRTPLNAILGYSRLLRGGILSGEKADRGLETLERNAQSLTQIVEDVLDVSRIVSGKIRLDVRPVHLPLVIDNAVATVQPAADARGVRVQTIVDSGVGPVSGDPDRLQQVVWNLLTNAVKFTSRGGRVQVRLERVNSHIELSVSDTGQGIAADFLPYVFDRFRQADASATRKAGGLGLGLAIVRHIVEMHGGTVEAASEGVGRGTTLSVRLPLMIVHATASSTPREHPRMVRTDPLTGLGDLGGVRVAAIDDEEDALNLLRIVLESAGASVTTFSSPVAALEGLAAEHADALIVDIGMPEMDGFEFISRLRASPDAALRQLPAAALTAFARSEDRIKALRSGFEMHLAKPVDPGELVASVATLVRRSRQA